METGTEPTGLKWVVVERTWRGRHVALRGVSFPTKAAAEAYITDKFAPKFRDRYHVEGRKPGKDGERMHCQICGRAILAASGLIAHHGYTRPHEGWQTASCFGARWRPWEVACDALPPAIEKIESYAADRAAFIAKLKAAPPDELVYERRDAWGKLREGPVNLPRPAGFSSAAKAPYRYDPKAYETIFWNMLETAERNMKGALADAAGLRKRLAAWKPAEAA